MVISRPDMADSETGTGAGDTDSRLMEASPSKDSRGGVSSSWMVKVCSTVAPRVAFCGESRVTCSVSSNSSSGSSTISTKIDFTVSPV